MFHNLTSRTQMCDDQQQQQQQSQPQRWSNNLDELIKDELGRKLFQEYIRATQTTNGKAQELNDILMLYMILQCLPQCNKEEQLNTMLKCTYNAYFKNKTKLSSLSTKSEIIRSKLPRLLEQLKYDFDLYENAKNELKEHLESTVYESFLSSPLYKTSIVLAKKSKSKDSEYLFGCIVAQSGQKQQQQQQVQKTDKSAFLMPVQPSKSKAKLLNDSMSSRRFNKSTISLPPFPYDKVTRIIPVSAQDSEIQSISSEAPTEDNYKHTTAKKQTTGIHDTTTVSTSSHKSKSKFQKFYKQMKQNAQLNKNVDDAIMPLAKIQQQQQQQQQQQPIQKPQQQPLSESDPNKFAQILIDKLNCIKYNRGGYDDEQSAGGVDEVDDDAERMIDEHVNRVFNQKLFISQPAQQPISTAKYNHAAKEVDIDDQKRHRDLQPVALSANKIELNNYDSGVSTRSVASIERVNDWLATTTTTTATSSKSIQEPVLAIKTTVAYYLPGEDLAYISTFNGPQPTLAQFKQLITKKGHFRYFFKTKSDLLDEECVVFQEMTDDLSHVPMFNSKVIAKIEKSNEV